MIAGNRLSFIIRFAVSSFAVGGAHAAEQSAATDRLGAGAMTSQVVMALGAVIICIMALAWVAKRLNGSSFVRQGGMKLLSSLPVGTKERLVLVEIEGEKILLGVTAGGITRLHTLPNSRLDQESALHAKKPQTSATTETETETENGEVEGKKDFSRYLKSLIVDGSNT